MATRRRRLDDWFRVVRRDDALGVQPDLRPPARLPRGCVPALVTFLVVVLVLMVLLVVGFSRLELD